jgi:hypothetical protein
MCINFRSQPIMEIFFLRCLSTMKQQSTKTNQHTSPAEKYNACVIQRVVVIRNKVALKGSFSASNCS